MIECEQDALTAVEIDFCLLPLIGMQSPAW
jgi:hypothetical protein